MTPSTDLKTIFKVAMQQAALGDLQFCLRNAEKRMQDFEMPAETIRIMREMRTRELSLIGVTGTVAMQRESWRLIQQYRASLPGWASSLKPMTLPVGQRRHGGRKWVSHRTVLTQRLTPLSLQDVQAIIHPDVVPIVTPAPLRAARKVAPKAAPVAAPAAEPQPCPTCAARVHARATNPKSKFGCPVCWKSRLMQTGPTTHECPNCGLVAIVNVGKAREGAA
jgi:predicted RNA-binding Zn-ribbon protein involved in translation (DUF1610 family)